MHVLKIVVSTNKSKYTSYELSKKLIVQTFKSNLNTWFYIIKIKLHKIFYIILLYQK